MKVVNRQAIILGYSDHAHVVLDILISNMYTPIAYCDQEVKENNPYNLEYLGSENDEIVLGHFASKSVFISIGDNHIRERIFNYLQKNDINLPFIAHKSAIISPSAKLGQASIIMPGAVINAFAHIGKAVICNSSSIIEHGCMVGNFSHIAPGAVLAGNVKIGSSSFIGANSVVKNGIKIGDNAIIGAGAVVVKDVPDNSLVYGNPAKIV